MDSLTLKLEQPIDLGSEKITELCVKWSPRALRQYSLPMSADGMILYQPYQLAQIGLSMSGKPDVLVDKMGAKDFQALARAVMGFFE